MDYRKLTAGDKLIEHTVRGIRLARSAASVPIMFSPRLVVSMANPIATKTATQAGTLSADTRMTPLEYQKQLRLQEARRLMLAEGATASTAGFAVGYNSPSQFS